MADISPVKDQLTVTLRCYRIATLTTGCHKGAFEQLCWMHTVKLAVICDCTAALIVLCHDA